VDTNYWIRALPEVDALYWQFNSVRDMDGGPTLHDYADTLRSRLEATGAHHLIVDVRHNNGGNTNLLRPLLRLLTWWEQDASDHEIFVVMGRNTFSAAQNFISRVEQWTDAVFVGEPSSSSPNFIGEETALVLPYSRVRGSISNRYWQNSDPTDDRPWIAPQVPVNLSSSAYFSGRDPALETIVKIIEHTEQAATP
jgi:tRNA-dihydrouridine synthase